MIHGGETKYIFRKIALESLPDDWAKRRKLGFPVPFKMWIIDDKYYNIIKEMFNKKFVGEFFDVDKINNLLDLHHEKKVYNTRKIYTIYAFLIWYERFFVDEK